MGINAGDLAKFLVAEADARDISLKDVVKEYEVRWVWSCLGETPTIVKCFPESQQEQMWYSAEVLPKTIFFIATESEVMDATRTAEAPPTAGD